MLRTREPNISIACFEYNSMMLTSLIGEQDRAGRGRVWEYG